MISRQSAWSILGRDSPIPSTPFSHSLLAQPSRPAPHLLPLTKLETASRFSHVSSSQTGIMATPPPLTTIFTPPASCVTDHYRSTNSPEYYDGLGPSPVASECFPSNWEPIPDFYFSPGICPAGYTGEATSIVVLNTRTETVVDCCPS
jgi:hypothetical protein